jgi:hypothetical protein
MVQLNTVYLPRYAAATNASLPTRQINAICYAVGAMVTSLLPA